MVCDDVHTASKLDGLQEGVLQELQQPVAEDVIDEGLINLGAIWTFRQTLILQNCEPVEHPKTASHEQDGRTSRSPASQAPIPTQVRGDRLSAAGGCPSCA